MTRPTKRTPEKDAAFFNALSEGASVTGAAKAAGYARACVYEYRNADEPFARAWDDAVEAGTDVLEDVAAERGKDHSDTLLIFLLKGRRPEKFKDRAQLDANVNVSGDVVLAALDALRNRRAS
jgi:hypothetical protein